MRAALTFLALGAIACGTPPARVPAPKDAAPVAAVVHPTAAAEPALANVGALEGPRALERFFEALERLEAGNATDDVRITQLGDSHTAADWETGPVRRQLQRRFGDGGRGFVPIGLPWRVWSQEGVLAGAFGQWKTEMNHPAARHATGDGIFGLSGFALATRQPGARAWLQVMTATSRVELDYLEQPGGGTFDLLVDGVRAARIATRAEERRSAFRAVDITEPAQHRIEARALGDGEVRLFGVALDRAEQRGLVLDALGINGARVATALSWSEAPWIEELRHRAPALVILAYGTNDAVDLETSLDAFETGVADVLRRVARAAPSASCLLLGPPDRASQSVGKTWTTPPRLLEIVARERRAAEAAGCAFFDRMAVMGGEGGMARWATEAIPRGQRDRVHLTRDGYAHIGSAFVMDLLQAYDRWRANRSSGSS
jgi:lysophospholipase L1-like esterase